MQAIIADSLLSCPECGHEELLTMPTDACLWFHECSGCHVLLKPQKGDCCVFCSYGSVPCPPIQLESTEQGIGGCGCGKS
ncbi:MULTISPECIES: GDCCVxC domain-containing (seleno)protein [unclassified Moritella]|uniref:GDCCVxC domain-containing (seleno)protein n=1 Tax=unclassified Moritella TaxID=2637987 RepID=UPI000A016C5B|nr:MULTISPECIES: GDCCVxC domain-containing (seleno)protein [unclassified Moritella]